MRFGAGDCSHDNGPSVPVVYDTGDKDSTTKLYRPIKGLYCSFQKLRNCNSREKKNLTT